MPQIVLDEAFHDLADVIKGKPIDETIIFDEYLPSQFQHHYNVLFLIKFLVCLVRVAGRLANWDGEIIPACTGCGCAVSGNSQGKPHLREGGRSGCEKQIACKRPYSPKLMIFSTQLETGRK